MCDNLTISHKGTLLVRVYTVPWGHSGQPTEMEHIQHVRQKCFMGLSKLRRIISHFLPIPTRVKLYNASTCITSLRLLLCVVALLWINTELWDEDYHFLF